MSAPDPEIAPGSIVVCMPASTPAKFADDAFADCARGCGTRVRHRPQVPDHAVKICLACAKVEIKAALAGREPVTTIVTAQTQRELALYYSGGRRQ
jgi:hypothetical protein